MPDQVIQPHPHVELRGGSVRIVREERDYISGSLAGLKNKGALYTFGFDGLQHRCNLAEAALNDIELPERYWNGVTFYACSRGPAVHPKSKYGFQSVVGIGVKVQRQNDEWVLLDIYKTNISSKETGEPHFKPFTSEQWAEVPDRDDDPNPYTRKPKIRFAV